MIKDMKTMHRNKPNRMSDAEIMVILDVYKRQVYIVSKKEFFLLSDKLFIYNTKI